MWDVSQRFNSLKPLLSRTSTLTPPPFCPGTANIQTLSQRRVLVVGAGGLGCEILKDLALSGFSDIHVVDIDTVELSNLNRQFLFRQTDIGQSKAMTAATFIMKRCPNVHITAHIKKIQELSLDFYQQFFIVIAGLDNVEARRWLNAALVSLVERDDDGNIDSSTVIPLIDGGTEGFKGQARLFFPLITSCYECSIETLPIEKTVPLCTIANVPRTPQHCIAYVLQIEWPKLISLSSSSTFVLGDIDVNVIELNTDSVAHIMWLFKRAETRAEKFGISGVSYSLTLQVVKNIVPAIASTNAIISAICVNECLKVATWSSMPLSNFFMYMGAQGVYARTFVYQRNEDCIVCGSQPVNYNDLSCTSTLYELIERLKNDPKLKLRNPALESNNQILYIPNAALSHLYETNLNEQLQNLFSSGTDVFVTDRYVLGAKRIVLRCSFKEFEADIEMCVWSMSNGKRERE